MCYVTIGISTVCLSFTTVLCLCITEHIRPGLNDMHANIHLKKKYLYQNSANARWSGVVGLSLIQPSFTITQTILTILLYHSSYFDHHSQCSGTPLLIKDTPEMRTSPLIKDLSVHGPNYIEMCTKLPPKTRTPPLIRTL